MPSRRPSKTAALIGETPTVLAWADELIARDMPTLVVVRRNAHDTFRHFKLMWAHKLGNDLDLIWDRRTGDRRRPDASVAVEQRIEARRDGDAEPPDRGPAHPEERRPRPQSRQPERRRAERRQRGLVPWETLAFVLVQQERPALCDEGGESVATWSEG